MSSDDDCQSVHRLCYSWVAYCCLRKPENVDNSAVQVVMTAGVSTFFGSLAQLYFCMQNVK